MIKLLNTFSCLEDADQEHHVEEIESIINKLVSYKDYDCALLCKYQDPAHKQIKQEILSCKLSEVLNEIERFDCKNGVDLVQTDEYLNLVIYGQNYCFEETNESYMITMAVQILPYNENREFMDITKIINGYAPVIAKKQFESKYN